MFLKQPTLWVSLATILAVAGCGGGGGGSDSSKPPVTNPPITNPDGNNSGVTLSGVATKGVLKGAQVTAYELDANGSRFPVAVGSTQTKADGSYELELTSAYTGGLIEVEVSVIAGTKMVCDASNCGGAAEAEEIELPADFVLSAIVEKPSAANTVSASVTAWSTMAAQRAKALVADSSKSLADATKQANAEVSQVVGFDIAKTTSRGLSQLEGATAAQAQYAVMNAAVAEILFAGGDASNLTSRLNSFTRALEDGVVGDASDSLNLADLSGAVRNVAGRVTLDAGTVEAINNQTSQYDAAGKEGLKPEYDEDLVVDEGASQAEKIEKFQTFVAQARTWTSKVQELDTDGITEAVGVDAQSVETILASNEDFAFVGLALDEATRFIVQNAASIQDYINSGDAQTLAIADREGTQIGSAALTFVEEGGLKISVAGSVSDEAAENYKSFNLVLDTNLPLDAVLMTDENGEGDANVSLGLAKLLASTSINLSGYVGDGQNNPLTLNSLSVNLELDQAIDSYAAEEVGNLFKSLALGGDVTIAKDGVTFSGAVALKVVKLISGFDVEGIYPSPISINYFRVSGEFSNAQGHSFAASAALDIQNASTFDVFAWSDYSGRNDYLYSSVAVESATVEALMGVSLDEMNYWSYWFSGYPSAGGYHNFMSYSSGEGSSEFDAPATDSQRQIVEGLVHSALLEEFAGDTQFVSAIEIDTYFLDLGKYFGPYLTVYYQLPDLETPTNFAKAAFSASVKVNIPELQAAQVTATINRTTLKGGSALANVKWDGGDYSIAVSSENVEAAEQVNIRFFNSQGYELNIQTGLDDKGEISITSGKALLNGEQVGSVELRRGLPVIVYPNGSEDIFESLF